MKPARFAAAARDEFLAGVEQYGAVPRRSESRHRMHSTFPSSVGGISRPARHSSVCAQTIPFRCRLPRDRDRDPTSRSCSHQAPPCLLEAPSVAIRSSTCSLLVALLSAPLAFLGLRLSALEQHRAASSSNYRSAHLALASASPRRRTRCTAPRPIRTRRRAPRRAPASPGSSLSARNLSRTALRSAILMSLRRCARNSAWSRNIRDPVQRVDLGLVEVVLRGRHIALEHAATTPPREPHVRLVGVGASPNDFGRRELGRGVVHLVLHEREEPQRLLLALGIVRREREDLPDALIDPRLARADLADTREQLVEVVRAGWPLQPLVVHREPFDDVLFETRRGHFRNCVPRSERTR